MAIPAVQKVLKDADKHLKGATIKVTDSMKAGRPQQTRDANLLVKLHDAHVMMKREGGSELEESRRLLFAVAVAQQEEQGKILAE